jgi:peroxiredoxin
VDLQESDRFRSLNVELLSIAADDRESWKVYAEQYRIQTPLLSDARNRVADRYGVMRWRVPPVADVDSAEPGHTFVLVDEQGRIAWIRDYGAPENGGLMYVPPEDLIPRIERALTS